MKPEMVLPLRNKLVMLLHQRRAQGRLVFDLRNQKEG